MPAPDSSRNSFTARKTLKPGLVIFSGLLLIVLWCTNTIVPDQLMDQVRPLYQIPWLESRWLYTWLLIFTGIFPLLFGWIPRPHFYGVWPKILLANIPVSLFFILWDIYFTDRGVWGFSAAYLNGMHLFNLPMEECLFFIIIPSSCAFIYWSLNSILPREPFARVEKSISWGLVILLTAIGLWKWEHIYTSTTTLLTAAFLLYHLWFIPSGYRGRFYLTWLITCIPFLIVNGVLTGGFTQGPVVVYNPDEYFGWRVGTIPVDDFIYSFLMLFANITLFEGLMRRKA